MDAAGVNSWLERYIAAWRSGDRAEIADLFSEDARYRYRPSDEPVVGREAIVDAWLEEPDEPGSWEAEYTCYVVDGDRAAAVGTSTYPHEGRRLRQRLPAALRRGGTLRGVHGVVREAVGRAEPLGPRAARQPRRS